MAERRCGTCGLWCEKGEDRFGAWGPCSWEPPPIPVGWVLRHVEPYTYSFSGTDCLCWRPHEEKGESDV